MKNLIKVAIASALSCLALGAEERYGFLNVVNLVPSKHSIDIRLADKQLVPAGLKPSTETGWFMIATGAVEIKIQHTEYKKRKTKLTITEGESQVIIIALELADSQESGPAPQTPNLRITSLPAYASKGHGIKAVSMIQSSNHFQFSNHKMELEYLKATEISDWTGREFEIKHQGKKIGSVNRSREHASHYLLLGTDHQGKYLSLLVNADVQKIPSWMEN
jgi:hypothetical protein